MQHFIFGRLLLCATIVTTIIISCADNKKTETTEADTTQTITDTSRPAPMADTIRPMVPHAEAVISGTYPDTAVSGTAKFDVAGDKVKAVFELTIPTKANKSVAVHIHEHGDCGDKGEMAHGHWNPTNAQHGKWGSNSFHSGDIGNIKLDAKGKGTLKLETDLWSLGGGTMKNILGKSIIVHGGVDDYTSQPSGNSGARIGCGIVQ